MRDTVPILVLTAVVSTAVVLAGVVHAAAEDSPIVEDEAALEGQETPEAECRSGETRAALFPLVSYHRDGEKTKVKVVNALVAEGYSFRREGDYRKTEVLHVPLFTLVKSEAWGEDEFDTRLIKLPFVGSVFRHKRTKDEEKIRFLFFSHTKKRKDVGRDATTDTPRVRRHRHRSTQHGSRR